MADEKLFYLGTFGETVEYEESEDLIKQAELFSTGTHRGQPYTVDDLDEIASNFNADDEIPIQIDHSQSAKDTVGYLQSVKRVGEKLMGELRVIDDVAKSRINKKLMSKLSVGLYLKKTDKGFRPHKLKEVSIVAFPQVKSARLFSENGYMSEYEEEQTGGANDMSEKEKNEQFDQKEFAEQIREQVKGEMAQEFKALQDQIKEMQTVSQEMNEKQIDMKVEKFQADSKIVPAQGEAVKKLLNSFSSEQMQAFDEFMGNAQTVDFSEEGQIDGGDDDNKDTRSKEQKEFDEFYEKFEEEYGSTL